MKHNFLIIAGIFAAISVVLGALGAHALKDSLSQEQLMSFETGVKYQMYHSLALIGIAALKIKYKSKFLVYAGWCFLIGILLFSFSIYLLSVKDLLKMQGLNILGPVTPFGGVSFIIGWLFLIIAGIELKNNTHHS